MAKEHKCKTLYQAAIIHGALFFEDVRQCRLNDATAGTPIAVKVGCCKNVTLVKARRLQNIDSLR